MVLNSILKRLMSVLKCTLTCRVYETVGIRCTYLSETEKLTKCKWAKKTHNAPLFYILCCVQYFIMTTDSYINENKTATFKKGDTVVMHSCGEANFPKYKGKIWTCQTDSYLDRGKQEVVFLEGFSGCFSTKYLQSVQS